MTTVAVFSLWFVGRYFAGRSIAFTVGRGCFLFAFNFMLLRRFARFVRLVVRCLNVPRTAYIVRRFISIRICLGGFVLSTAFRGQL